MLKYILKLSIILLLFSCGGGGSDSPYINGCTDDCAINYNVDATQDDGSCIYSYLGTYIVEEITQDGYSWFDPTAYANPLISAAISFGVATNGTGVYGNSFLFSDGTEISSGGTFTNTLTSITFYETGGTPEVYNISKANCLELDLYGTINNSNLTIELEWYSSSLEHLKEN